MRRLLAANLLAVLLTPWTAALSGAAVPVVPCPMHRADEARGRDHAAAVAGTHHESAQHQSGSHHGTSARGCNCAGECGRSAAAFDLPAEELVRVRANAMTEVSIVNERLDF